MRRKGRPPFETTALRQRKVEKMASTGMTRDRVAAAIGISQTTLNKYFGKELIRGHAAYLATQLREATLRSPSGVLLWLEQRKRKADEAN